MQHPDITAACRDGYPSWKHGGVEDCPELRDEYIDQCAPDLVKWVRENYPDIVDEWIEQSDYSEWLEEMNL